MGRYIDPLTDWSFKHLFGSEPRKYILIAFLNDLFAGEKVITDLSYGPNEHNGDSSDIRKAIFDLYCTGDKGEKFIVEVQRGRQDFFWERSVFYVSRTISEQLPAGKEHFRYDISEVYLIAVLEFKIDETSEQYFSNICLMDRKTHEIFYNRLGLKFLILPNFNKAADELETDLDKWLYILKNMSRLNQMPIYLNKRVFKRIFQIAEINKLTKEEREMYNDSLKYKWDYENTIETAMKEGETRGEQRGRLIGKKEGKLEGKLDAARDLLTAGFSAAEIAEILKLPLEEIKKL